MSHQPENEPADKKKKKLVLDDERYPTLTLVSGQTAVVGRPEARRAGEASDGIPDWLRGNSYAVLSSRMLGTPKHHMDAPVAQDLIEKFAYPRPPHGSIRKKEISKKQLWALSVPSLLIARIFRRIGRAIQRDTARYSYMYIYAAIY